MRLGGGGEKGNGGDGTLLLTNFGDGLLIRNHGQALAADRRDHLW